MNTPFATACQFLAVIVAVLGAFACSATNGQQTSSRKWGEKDYSLHRNIQYTTHLNSPLLRNRLDVYQPKERQGHPTPVVVFVHGGGWKFGDKFLVNKKPAWLAKHGIALVSVNYRFWPDAKFDQQASDVAAAVKWVAENSNKYDFDADRIYLMGHSAGAHLAALVGTDEKYLRPYELKPSDLAGVIPIDGGGLNVALQIEMAETRANVKTYRDVFSNDETTQQEASPFFHLKSKRKYPPFLIAHVASRRTTKIQAERFAEKLNELGGSASVIAAENKTHLTINRELGTAKDPTSDKILRFIVGKGDREASDVPFKNIKLQTTGGFAGINRIIQLNTSGDRKVNGKQTKGLNQKQLERVEVLAEEIEWSKIPESTKKAGAADVFLHRFKIEFDDTIFEFEIDDLSLGDHPKLQELVRILVG